MPPRYTTEETESLIAYLSHPTRLLQDPSSLEVFAELGPGSRKHLWSRAHKPEGWRLHFLGLVDGDLRVLEAARKMHNRLDSEGAACPDISSKPAPRSILKVVSAPTTNTQKAKAKTGASSKKKRDVKMDLTRIARGAACQVLEAMRIAMRDGFESFDDEIDEEQRSSEAEHESEDSDDEKPRKKVSKQTTKRPRDESEDEEAPPPKKLKKILREPPVFLHHYAQTKGLRNAAEFKPVSKRAYDRSSSPARRSAYSSSTIQDDIDPDTGCEQKNRRSTSSTPGGKKVPGVVPPRRFYDAPPRRRAYRGELDRF